MACIKVCRLLEKIKEICPFLLCTVHLNTLKRVFKCSKSDTNVLQKGIHSNVSTHKVFKMILGEICTI